MKRKKIFSKINFLFLNTNVNGDENHGNQSKQGL